MSTVDLKKHKPAFHFEDAEQEYQSGKQGVWLFMTTEVLMFGGLLVAYLIFKGLKPEVFYEGSTFLDWRLGATNTVVLISSSLTMALAIYYIRLNKRKEAIWSLILTLFFATIFMVIKYFEYSHKFHMGIFPGSLFSYEGAENAQLALYFSFYYLLTGLHGLHVLVGMGLITWMLLRIRKGHYGPDHWTGVEGVGIFWHLVDLVWIYLFPLLYLL